MVFQHENIGTDWIQNKKISPETYFQVEMYVGSFYT